MDAVTHDAPDLNYLSCFDADVPIPHPTGRHGAPLRLGYASIDNPRHLPSFPSRIPAFSACYTSTSPLTLPRRGRASTPREPHRPFQPAAAARQRRQSCGTCRRRSAGGVRRADDAEARAIAHAQRTRRTTAAWTAAPHMEARGSAGGERRTLYSPATERVRPCPTRTRSLPTGSAQRFSHGPPPR